MLSVIVLNHNKADYSRLLLDSLLETVGVDLEFVLVDNGSSDDTPAVLESFGERAEAAGWPTTVLPFETNVGAIVGRNEAMAVASHDYFAFLDNDVMVRDRDWAARLLSVLEAEPKVGIVSPKLVFPWPPHEIEFAGCDVTPGGRIVYRGRGEASDTPAYNRPRDCACLISACWVFRRELYDDLGGLDEVYSPVQYEDLDFCYTAREAGWRCRYEPTVEMYHWEHTTTAGSSGINFELVTLRNGRTFKQRWEEAIARDAVGSDDDAAWREIAKFGWDEVPPAGYRR